MAIDQETQQATPRRWLKRLLAVALLLGITLVVGYPFYVDYQLGQARASLSKRRTEQAIQRLESLGMIARNNGERLFLLARCYRRFGDTEDFRAQLLAAAESGFPIEILDREQWLMSAQIGDMRASEPHLQELLMNPGEDGAEICEAFVNGYFQNYEFPRAFPLIEAWRSDFPDDPQPYVFLGLFQNHISNYAQAAEHYRTALKLDPSQTDTRRRLATQLVKLHQYEEAQREFAICREQKPNDPATLSGLAECLIRSGRDAEALQLVDQILTDTPDYAPAVLQKGRLELAAGEYQIACDVLEPLVEQLPGDTEARYAFASALQGVGRVEEARSEFDFVERSRAADGRITELQSQLRETGDDLETRVEIARLLLEFGHYEEGRVWMRGVLDRFPAHQTALKILVEHYEQIQDETMAEHYRNQLRQSDVAPDDGASTSHAIPSRPPLSSQQIPRAKNARGSLYAMV